MQARRTLPAAQLQDGAERTVLVDEVLASSPPERMETEAHLRQPNLNCKLLEALDQGTQGTGEDARTTLFSGESPEAMEPAQRAGLCARLPRVC